MSDYFTELIGRLEVKCPLHNSNMEGKRVEIKTGYSEYVRKIMYIGKCTTQDCHKWFDYTNGIILWP